MKFRWLTTVCCVAAFGWAISSFNVSNLLAQSTKTKEAPAATVDDDEEDSVVTVAIAPIDTFLPDVQYLLRQVGQSAVGGSMSGVINQFAGGLDRKRPIGLFVDLDESGQPQPIAVLPVSDVDAFFSQLKIYGEPNDLGDGLFEFTLGPQSVYVKHEGDWLFAGQTEDSVSEPPVEQAASLAKTLGKYDLHIQLNPQNIPDNLIELLISQIRAGYEQSMEAQRAGMSDEEADAARATGEQAVKNLEDVIHDTEKLIVRLGVNKSEKKTVLDIGSQFIAESRFAEQVEKLKSATASFGAIPVDGSAISFQALQLVAPEDVAQIENTLSTSLKTAYKSIEESAKDPESAKKATELIQKLADLLIETVKAGQLESAGNVSLEGNSLNLVSSVTVADGAKVEALAKEIADVAAKEKGPFKLQVGTGKYKGVNLHKASFTLPKEADDSARKIFGDTLNISIGTSPKAVHVALGKDAEATLKAAVDRVGSKPSSPAELFKMKLVLSQVLQFANSIKANPVTEGMINSLGQSSGNDKILVDSQTVTRGTVVRITVEDGVLKAISSGIKAGNGGGGF